MIIDFDSIKEERYPQFKGGEKIKKDAKNSQVKTKVIITVAVIAVIFGVLYTICRVIGGAPEDFAGAAAPWVFLGIGTAGAITYLGTIEKSK